MRALLGLVLGAATAATAVAQPNVLILIGDDLGNAQISSLNPNDVGGAPPPTPNIDSIGNNGIRFRNGWVAPACSMTRAALLTGRWGLRTGVRQVGGRMQLSETTMPEVLGAAGYESGLFGKWHLGTANNQGGDDAPRVAGFDKYAGILGGGVQNYFDWNKTEDGVTTQNVTTYTTKDQVNEAIEWINGTSGPWSCVMAFNAPHSPWHDPNESLHGYDLSSATNRDRYNAAIEAMDTEIGRLLNAIDPNELANTYIVFIGDNGTPGQMRELPYIWGKGSVYEGGVNTPYMMSGPGIVGTDRDYEGMVNVTDLFVTFAELAGVDLAASYPDVVLDGVSLVDVLEDPNAGSVRDYNYAESVSGTDVLNGRYAVRADRYKLVYINQAYQFYDLETDPYETMDLVPGGLSAAEQLAYDDMFGYLQSLRADLCTADVNGDAVVDLSDLSDVLVLFGEFTTEPVDIDGSGQVTLSDLAVLLNEFGRSCW